MPSFSFIAFILELIFGCFVIIASLIIALNIKNYSHDHKQVAWILLPCFGVIFLLLFLLHNSIANTVLEVNKITTKQIRIQ
jgi:Trk-type K+ transport system membrane component